MLDGLQAPGAFSAQLSVPARGVGLTVAGAGPIVPVGDDWMLSGAQHLYAASERHAMLWLATELAIQHPRARTSTK